jgi:hypothetical protein
LDGFSKLEGAQVVWGFSAQALKVADSKLLFRIFLLWMAVKVLAKILLLVEFLSFTVAFKRNLKVPKW